MGVHGPRNLFGLFHHWCCMVSTIIMTQCLIHSIGVYLLLAAACLAPLLKCRESSQRTSSGIFSFFANWLSQCHFLWSSRYLRSNHRHYSIYQGSPIEWHASHHQRRLWQGTLCGLRNLRSWSVCGYLQLGLWCVRGCHWRWLRSRWCANSLNIRQDPYHWDFRKRPRTVRSHRRYHPGWKGLLKEQQRHI